MAWKQIFASTTNPHVALSSRKACWVPPRRPVFPCQRGLRACVQYLAVHHLSSRPIYGKDGSLVHCCCCRGRQKDTRNLFTSCQKHELLAGWRKPNYPQLGGRKAVACNENSNDRGHLCPPSPSFGRRSQRRDSLKSRAWRRIEYFEGCLRPPRKIRDLPKSTEYPAPLKYGGSLSSRPRAQNEKPPRL